MDNYGRRLMPTILHDEAKHNPQRTFAVVARSDNLEDGFVQVTFGQVARAVNHVSHWLQTRFEAGDKPPHHATLAYIGVPDLRYNIIFYAAVQCRYKVFLPSPRNATSANISLLEQTQCSRLVHSIEVSSVAKTLQAAVPGLQCEQLPSLNELLAASTLEYMYDLQYADVYREPIVILHSSGSTGEPKPVASTHGTFATFDVRDWPTVPGRINHDVLRTLRFSQQNSCIYDAFPPFHLAGFLMKIIVPLHVLTAPIFGPPLRPPSGALAAEMIRLHRPRGVVIPPSITEQLYHEHGGSDLFKQVDVLLFAGGPLSQLVGDEISKYTTLCQFYGSTETGQIRQLIPLPGEWSYIYFHPNEPLELQPAGDGMFELVVFPKESLERTSPLYHNYPDLREWRTKDLFKPHPSKPDLWKFHARRDDILVFSSGEKLNPIPMESSITAVSGVTGALVVGQGYPRAALLIELAPEIEDSLDLRQDLWSAIEVANALLPGHGRIARSMIIIADSNKLFVRAGKGTVVRRLTEELYAAEIRELHEAASTKLKREPIALKPSAFLVSDVSGLVRSILGQVSVDDQMNDEDNFYAHGMDSLKTVEAVGLLKASLLPYKSATDLDWVSAEILYRSPTIKQLSSILLDFLNNGTIPKKRDPVAEMQAKIAEYSRDLPQNLAPLNTKASNRFSIAITGTTGYLGGRLLTELAQNPRISRIYCLNRSPSAQQLFEKHHPGKSAANLVFLHVNLSSTTLGLPTEDYTSLLQDCNLIIHNAWRVDFNLSLSSFSDNLQSVAHLVALSATSPLRPRILFISSISATGLFSTAGSPQFTVPETLVELGTTMDLGYAESKHVAEHVLAAASKVGVPVSIIRMGQITPSSSPEEEGTWPVDDVVPVFLRTCKVAGILASDFVDTVNWVPVDYAAMIVADIMEHDVYAGSGVRFYNVVHPRPLPWSAVLGAIRSWCGEDTRMVSLLQWLDGLQALDGGDAQSLDRFPALRMWKVYDIMARRGKTHAYEMGGLMGVSKRVGLLPAINAEMLGMRLQRL